MSNEYLHNLTKAEIEEALRSTEWRSEQPFQNALINITGTQLPNPYDTAMKGALIEFAGQQLNFPDNSNGY